MNRYYRAKNGGDSDSEDEIEVVRVIGSEMYYTGDICAENNLEFVQKFKSLETHLLKCAADLCTYKPAIRVHINSDGGDLHCGFALMNLLERSRVHVTTIASGTCASAATLFLLGGRERLCAKNATVLIHQLSSGCWGKYTELKQEMKTFQTLMKMLSNVYESKCEIPAKRLARMFKKDITLTPKKALKYKIVAGID